MNSELESITRSYSRLSRDVVARMEFACDLNNDDALRAVEQEKEHLDQAFFVLGFAALEKQVTQLASARLPSDDAKRGMRDAKFEKRWDAAVKVAEEELGAAPSWASSRALVLSWYKIRSDIAHGDAPSGLSDIPPVIDIANDVSTALESVRSA